MLYPQVAGIAPVSSFEAEEGVHLDHLRDLGDGYARSYKDLYCYEEGFEFQESL